jgi:cholesterol oxidase
MKINMSNGKLGFTFKEKMSGGFALEETDPAVGAEKGKADVLTMHGAITIDDLEAFRADPNHAGVLDVRMDWPPFGNDLAAPGGVFNLFSPSGDPKLKLMVYEWGLERNGQKYYFAGHKNVRVHPLYDLWKDTTTLYTQLHQGLDKTGPVVGAGIISLGAVELMQMVGTFKALNAKSAEESALAVGEFGRFFLGELWDTYVRKAG